LQNIHIRFEALATAATTGTAVNIQGEAEDDEYVASVTTSNSTLNLAIGTLTGISIWF